MINYFVTAPHGYTVSAFLAHWPNAVGQFFRVVPYEQLSSITCIGTGLYIFSDIDRLDARTRHNAQRLCDLATRELGTDAVLNRPHDVLLRRELLSALWQDGSNHFRVFDLDRSPDAVRYPVFIRMAHGHDGPIGGLISGPAEYRHALQRLRTARTPLANAIVTEFCDTADSDGVYRKYSAFRIGERIVPGHILFSTNWVTKDSPPEPVRDQERDYLANNPHRSALLHIFERAHIEYGRIDYGLLDDRIQVWEINTNPMLIQDPSKYSPDKLPLKRRLVDELSDALLARYARAHAGSARRIAVPIGTFTRVRLKNRVRYNRWFSGLTL